MESKGEWRRIRRRRRRRSRSGEKMYIQTDRREKRKGGMSELC